MLYASSRKDMKKLLSLLMVMVLLYGLSGCHKETSISIDDLDKDIALTIGESKKIKVTVSKKVTLIISSSHPNVATIEKEVSVASDNAVYITALSEGNSIMTLAVEGKDNQVIISVTVVKPEPTEVKIVGPNMIVLKDSIQLTAWVIPEKANQDLTWESSNEGIATVDASGKITTHNLGEVIITATSVKTSIKNAITIEVKLPVPTGIDVIGTTKVLVNQTVRYEATIAPLLAGQTVKWSVSDETFASITAEGILTAKSPGTIKVIATSTTDSSIKKDIDVKIFEIPQTVEIEGPEGLNMGDTAVYTASVKPELSSQEVKWSINDTSIAIISQDGMLTPVKPGTIKVVATSKYLENIKIEYEVIIYATPTKVSFRGPEIFVVGGKGNVFAQIEVANGQIADQTNVSYASDNPAVITVDELTGEVIAVSVGTANITITSKADLTKKDSALITVKAVDDVYDISTILITKEYSNYVSFYSSVDYSTHIVGINAFTTLSEAICKAPVGGKIVFLEGTYSEDSTVSKNNLTISGSGEAIITGVINIDKDIEGLSITNLDFTDNGSVLGSPEAGIKNFTFKNNHIYDPQVKDLSVLCFPVGSDELFNSNFIISNNVFEVINLNEIDNRYIRGGNLVGLTLEDNRFVGLPGYYTDAVRFGGTGTNSSESSTKGVGLGGEAIIKNNEFVNIGLRAIWIRRYSATSIIIENNLIDYAGDEAYGGGIQIETWTEGVNTDIKVRYNTFKNIKGFYGVRINNKNVVLSSTWTAAVTFNKFLYVPINTKYIEGFSTDELIDGANNYYKELSEAAFAGVKNYTQAFESEYDYDLASILDQADKTYGVDVSSEDFEEHDNISYKDTSTVMGGLNWTIKEVYLNPDLHDKTNATGLQGNKMIRLRGANIASMELTNFYDGITTLAIDVKYYNDVHSDAVIKVSKLVEGGSWTEVTAIILTDKYSTQYIGINESGNVKVRIDATTHSVNIDNIKIFQSKDLFTKNFKIE
jgi:uncharacterized protein YjdB